MPKISEHVEKVCQPGKAECCRYLMIDRLGWDCAKLTPTIRALLDERVRLGTMNATGDNCEGKERP